MARYAILRRGDVVARVDEPDPRAALKTFLETLPASARGDAKIVGTGGKASMAVDGIGIFRAERDRDAKDNVRDALRRAAALAAQGDEISAASWMREAEKRAAGADPLRYSEKRRQEE